MFCAARPNLTYKVIFTIFILFFCSCIVSPAYAVVVEGTTDTNGTSIAIGEGSSAFNLSTALGYMATAGTRWAGTEFGQIAIGYKSVAEDGSRGIAIGNESFAQGGYSIAIGHRAEVLDDFENDQYGSIGSMAIGTDAKATRVSSTAVGFYAKATGYLSTSLGRDAVASGSSSTAIGQAAVAIGEYSVALGTGSRVEAYDSYVVSVGDTLYKGITRRIVNMSAGINDTDAVNVSQLKKQGTDVASALGGTSSYSFNSSDGTGTLTTGLRVGDTTYTNVQSALDAVAGTGTTNTWSLRANNGTAYTVGNGGSVNLRNGSNMTVNNDGSGNFTFAVSSTPTFTTVRTGNVTMSSTGIAMNNQKVTSLAAGSISTASTDAINGSQLYSTNSRVTTLEGDVADISSDLTALDALAVKYDSTAKSSVTLGTGSNRVSIKNVADGVNANDAVNKGQLDAGIADAIASGKWNLKINDATAEEISGGKTVTLKDGTNIAITKDASGNYVFSTVASPAFDSITINNSSLLINSTGINMGGLKITNVQRGDISEGSTDAVTGGQLYETNQTIQQLDGLAVKYDNTNKESITLEGTGGTTVTNVKAGELSETSTDAVNGSQLYETNQNLASLDGLVVKYKEGSTNRLELNDGDNGTVRISNVATPENDTDAANKKYVDDKTTDISEDLEGLSGSAVKYDEGSDKTKITLEGTGGTNITNVKAGELSETSTDAVNGSQLYATNQNLASLDSLAVKYDDESKTSITLGNGTDKVAIKNVADGIDANDAVNKGQLDKELEDTLAAANAKSKWSLKVNDGAAEEIGDGKVVTLKDGTNIAITKDASGNYVFSTVAAPEFDEITIRNTNISISNTGIDMGDKKIINLQRGDVSEGSSDAVTGGQLYETNQTIEQLDELAVKYDEGSNKTKVTLEGEGGTTITNVKAAELNETSTDAVNGSQLYTTNQNLASLDALVVKYKEGSTNRLELNDGDNYTVRISNVATPENDTDAANKKYVDDKVSDLSEDVEGLDASAVKYDAGSNKTKVTLEGEGGTTITNVKAAELTQTSTDAVNGSQLYATNQNLASLDGLAVKYDDETKTSITLGNGTDNVTIKNVADGVDAKDAVNKGQLDKGLEDTLAAANAKSKWSLKVNDGEAEEIGDGKVVTLKDGTNVAITKDADGNYVFSTIAAPEFDSITISNTNISISNTGINMGGLKITNLQNGDISEGSTDAVTGDQLNETNERVSDLEDGLDTLDGLAVKYDDEGKNSITLEGSTGTKISNVADGVDKSDAVNKGQLDGVKAELEEKIDGSVTEINTRIDGVEEDITNLDGRVTVNENDISIIKDALGDLSGAAVTYDDETKSTVTLKGEDGTKISNIADGTEDSDAVNLGQLNEVRDLSEANAEKIEEHGVYIENHEQEFKTLQTVLGDGYSNPTFNTIQVGNISSDGININMGGGIITGLGDGGIYPGSTDAVTGNQLWNAYKRMDDLQESINIVGAHAAAMSGLHSVPYNPYEPTTLSAAFGTYRDEYAVAVGVFHYVRSNLMFNLGASLCSDGDIMGRAGVSIAVGPNSKKKPELARDMVTMQQIQVQSQYRIQELEAEIAALKQQITQITSASK